MKLSIRPLEIMTAGILPLFLSAGLLFAEVPIRTEQLIYSILAFNGNDYSGTFATEESDTIFLIAGEDNFITLRKTLVYFWPITGEWKTDTSLLDFILEGTIILERTGGKHEVIEPRYYTYYNIQGEYSSRWQVAGDEKAHEVWIHYQSLVRDNLRRMDEYQKALENHENVFKDLNVRIRTLRETGRDPTEIIGKLRSLKIPEPPDPVQGYNVPPQPVRKAFILNLPEGNYRIHFRTVDGLVMERSEKNLVVFERRRTGGTGYDIIPADRWTRSEESTTPLSVLYVNGSTDLFLRPFIQDEFNDYFYARMQSNDARGNPNVMKWVRLQQVPAARLGLTVPGQGFYEVKEEPYFVEQAAGSSLGYRIVPYDPENKHRGKDPSLIAFRVPMGSGPKVIHISAKNRDGLPLPGSERQIRVVAGPRGRGFLLLFSLLPIGIMMIVLVLRKRRYFE